MIPPPDAATWAATVRADRVHPEVLEAHVLRPHGPELVEALGCREIRERTDPPSPWRRRLLVAGALVVIVLPIAAAMVLPQGQSTVALADGRTIGPVGSRDGISLTTALIIAGVLFWLTLLLPLAGVVAWLRRGRTAQRGDPTAVVAVWCGIWGAVALGLLALRDVDPWSTWSAVPMAAVVLAGVAVPLVLRVRSRPAPAPPSARAEIRDWPAHADAAVVAARLDALDAGTRTAALEQRDGAMAVLVERGLLSEETREVARRLPLGRLGDAWTA